MAEGPDVIMQIPRNKFLSRWLHGEILYKKWNNVKTFAFILPDSWMAQKAINCLQGEGKSSLPHGVAPRNLHEYLYHLLSKFYRKTPAGAYSTWVQDQISVMRLYQPINHKFLLQISIPLHLLIFLSTAIREYRIGFKQSPYTRNRLECHLSIHFICFRVRLWNQKQENKNQQT